jgi:[ribosomal protein S5]-alanine N-acetyltransferase
MPATRTVLARGTLVYLRRPVQRDASPFLTAVESSKRLHRPWVEAPSTPSRFATYVRCFSGPRSRDSRHATHVGMLVCRREDHAPVGVFNFSEIVRGAFQSAYLGYYGFVEHAGRGYMSEGLALVLRVGFGTLRLHRIEVNVQPANTPSISLVRRGGFTREGFSRRYVKIAGRWRDHERWALLVEDWRIGRPRSRTVQLK